MPDICLPVRVLVVAIAKPELLEFGTVIIPDVPALKLPTFLEEYRLHQLLVHLTGARHAGLGPDVTPHVLRHTWATWFYGANKDVNLLKERGGWRETDTAFRYSKLAPSDIENQLNNYGWDFDFAGKWRENSGNPA